MSHYIILNDFNVARLTMSFRSQLDATGSGLKIIPQSGTVGPESTMSLTVQLTPTEEKKFSESILCKVNQKLRPLRLDIRGEGYCLMPSLKLVDKGRANPVRW